MANLNDAQWIRVEPPQPDICEEDLEILRELYDKSNTMGEIDTPDGPRTFSVPYELRRRLDRVREGARVRIVYHGERTPPTGRTYKDFEVFVPNEDDIIKPE